MKNQGPSKQRSTAKQSRVVPCDVGGRSQRWMLKVRQSGLLALRPLGEPVPTSFDRLVESFLGKL